MYIVKFNMCFQYIIPGTMSPGASAVELTYNPYDVGLLYRYTRYVLFGTDTAPDPVYSIGCKHTLAGFYTVL